MPKNAIGLWRGTSSVSSTMEKLGLTEDGCEGGRLLWVGVSGIQERDAGGITIPNHSQPGGGCGGATLGQSDGGESRREEQAQRRGQTPKFPLLRR